MSSLIKEGQFFMSYLKNALSLVLLSEMDEVTWFKNYRSCCFNHHVGDFMKAGFDGYQTPGELIAIKFVVKIAQQLMRGPRSKDEIIHVSLAGIDSYSRELIFQLLSGHTSAFNSEILDERGAWKLEGDEIQMRVKTRL